MAVIVVPDYSPTLGGIGRQAGNHIRGLTALGVPAHVLTRRYDATWARHEVIDGIAVHRWGLPGRGPLSEKGSLLLLWWWLVRRRQQLAMVQTIMYCDFAVMATLAGLRRKTIVIWGAHGEATAVLGPAGNRLRRVQRSFRRRVLKGSRHVALTPAIDQELGSLGVSNRTVIPVPVDGRRFRSPTPIERAEARERLGVAEDELVFIYTGRFDPDKGLGRLAEAFAAVLRGGTRARLVLLGSGDTEVVRKALRALELDSRTVMPGVVSDVETYLWASDIFVLPSIREGLSNSLAEAMSCELACVAAAEAGGDQVLYGNAGLVPPSASVADLTEALLLLTHDADLRRRLGTAAGIRAQMFASDRVAASYDSVLSTARDLQ